MRVLVEQTRAEVTRWVGELTRAFPEELAPPPEVHVLMGGESSTTWRSHPEAETVIIGTQDMLLSRSLNRGYGMSRYQWPVEFGLLNNDCLWVLDEVQIMGTGLLTSCQLDSFRHSLGSYGRNESMWASATLERSWVETVDFSPPPFFEIGAADHADPRLARRLEAPRMMREAGVRFAPKVDLPTYADGVAKEILSAHRSSRLTLAVFNTVERAAAAYRALKRLQRGPGPEIVLAHSRFRPQERKRWAFLRKEDLLPAGGRILVATQVVEAGVDLSASRLFTELCPWSSLVQRLGRCNRFGEDPDAEVRWMDIDETATAPYDPGSMVPARERLKALEGKNVTWSTLQGADLGPLSGVRSLLRRRDFLELFDTTPDLSGADIDVSRFIREGEDLDVLVFWRNVDQDPSEEEPVPVRDELCPVPVGAVRTFLEQLRKRNLRGWEWDHLERKWRPATPWEVRPGQFLLFPSAVGGYDPAQGWAPGSRSPVTPVPSGDPPSVNEDPGGRPDVGGSTAPLGYVGAGMEGMPGDGASGHRYWQTLAAHGRRTREEMRSLLDGLGDQGLGFQERQALLLAAELHDLGKSHEVFQRAIRKGASSPPPRDGPSDLWAKSPGRWIRYERPYFRHELASAVALLQLPLPEGISREVRDLAAFLVASHHGKVRASLRSLPGEQIPPEGKRFARGVWEGDRLPSLSLGRDLTLPSVTLELSMMEMGIGEDGTPSWQDRVLGLRDSGDFGPFRLAYLEALLRAADARASESPGEEGTTYV
jgi:CRISPR-associated endonuclease/helicase Cas3